MIEDKGVIMSLLDDARRVANLTPLEEVFSDDSGSGYIFVCAHCKRSRWGHAPDCTWLSMPKIVKVLEAAEAWRAAYEKLHRIYPYTDPMSVNEFREGALGPPLRKAERALLAALRGEDVKA